MPAYCARAHQQYLRQFAGEFNVTLLSFCSINSQHHAPSARRYHCMHTSLTSLPLSVAILSTLAMLVGCSSEPTLPPPPPPIDPAAVTIAVMQLVDVNKNGQLERAELVQFPGLAAAMDKIDTDSGGSITSVELQNRLTTYDQLPVGVIPFTCVVMSQKTPIAGVQARLIPEPFFENILKPASGTSDASGLIVFTVDGSTDSGVPRGMYRLELSGNSKVPEHYKAPTKMGVELMYDRREIESGLFLSF